MSFFQGPQNTLARDLWDVPGISVQSATVIQDDWQLVPTTFEGVIEWVYVRSSGRQRDWTRTYAILYQNPGDFEPSEYQYPLVVRIQGFIKACNLAPLGNWDGEREGAVRAKQYISLSSHGQYEPWLPVLRGLRNIRQMVHNSLTRGVSRRVEPEPLRDADIYISRRVFNKIRDEEKSSRGVYLAPMDDPEGWYPRVSSDWSVADKLVLYRVQSDGTEVPCNWLVFGPGDFVDIAASFDVCFRGHQGIHINLNILQVAQVVEKGNTVTQLTDETSELVYDHDGPVRHDVIRTGFATDGDDPMIRSF